MGKQQQRINRRKWGNPYKKIHDKERHYSKARPRSPAEVTYAVGSEGRNNNKYATLKSPCQWVTRNNEMRQFVAV